MCRERKHIGENQTSYLCRLPLSVGDAELFLAPIEERTLQLKFIGLECENRYEGFEMVTEDLQDRLRALISNIETSLSDPSSDTITIDFDGLTVLKEAEEIVWMYSELE